MFLALFIPFLLLLDRLIPKNTLGTALGPANIRAIEIFQGAHKVDEEATCAIQE